MFRNSINLTILILSLIITACNHQPDPQGMEAQTGQHQALKDVEYLASDELGGRETGTPGNTMAMQYIEQRFDITRAADVWQQLQAAI